MYSSAQTISFAVSLTSFCGAVALLLTFAVNQRWQDEFSQGPKYLLFILRLLELTFLFLSLFDVAFRRSVYAAVFSLGFFTLLGENKPADLCDLQSSILQVWYL